MTETIFLRTFYELYFPNEGYHQIQDVYHVILSYRDESFILIFYKQCLLIPEM